MKKIQVVGCLRSGTTLMHELLATCYAHDARSPHERSILHRAVPVTGDGLYLGKKPSDVCHVQPVFEADPDLWLVYLLRDPRGVITSRHPSKPDLYFSSFERWRRYEQAAADMKAHPRFIEVRYEDLVLDPLGTQARLERRMPFLERRHGFDEFDKHAAATEPAEVSLLGVRPVSPDTLDKWREHLPRIAFQLARYPDLPACLVEYGYEPDDRWCDDLAGIPPVTQDYGELRPGRLQQWETALRFRIKTARYLRRLRAGRQ